MVWLKFPTNKPSQGSGKYLVRLKCADRSWTSLKSWEKTHIHNLHIGCGHDYIEDTWILGQEFEETEVIEFIDERY